MRAANDERRVYACAQYRTGRQRGFCGACGINKSFHAVRKSGFRDLVGQRFGRLTVMSLVGTDARRSYMWNVRCDCGSALTVATSSLVSGNTRSCGCFQRELVAARTVKHGMSHTPTHATWSGMIDRCTNPNSGQWKDYGGRGIRVCARWMDNIENFIEDMGIRPRGMTIDRIDNNAHYEKSNCRWATPKQQSRNTRRNHLITYGGESLCISEWAERRGIPRSTICVRLLRGWTVERALSLPARVGTERVGCSQCGGTFLPREGYETGYSDCQSHRSAL